jgi:hypothetical protein
MLRVPPFTKSKRPRRAQSAVFWGELLKTMDRNRFSLSEPFPRSPNWAATLTSIIGHDVPLSSSPLYQASAATH